MAIVFTESFDWVAGSADLSTKWAANVEGSLGSGSGRRNDNAWVTENYDTLQVTLSEGPYETLIVGFAANFDSLSNSGDFLAFLAPGGAEQFQLERNSDGTLEFFRGLSSVETSSCAISACQWNYFEVKVTAKNSPSGAYTLRVNGAEWMSASGIDAQNQSSSGIGGIVLGDHESISIGKVVFDDIVVISASTGSPSDFIGDVYVDVLSPSAAGASASWSPSPAGSNFQNVDETTPDGDTTYVSSSTAGDRDSYTFQQVSASSASYFGVMVWASARKDDSASRAFHLLASQSASMVEGGSQALNTSYALYGKAFGTAPSGGAWTQAEINATEFGFELDQ